MSRVFLSSPSLFKLFLTALWEHPRSLHWPSSQCCSAPSCTALNAGRKAKLAGMMVFMLPGWAALRIILLVLFGFPGSALLSTMWWCGEGRGKGIWEQHFATDSKQPLSWERGYELLRVRTFLIFQFPHFYWQLFLILVCLKIQRLWFNYSQHGTGNQILMLFISSLIALSYTQHKVQTYTQGKMIQVCICMYICW